MIGTWALAPRKKTILHRERTTMMVNFIMKNLPHTVLSVSWEVNRWSFWGTIPLSTCIRNLLTGNSNGYFIKRQGVTKVLVGIGYPATVHAQVIRILCELFLSLNLSCCASSQMWTEWSPVHLVSAIVISSRYKVVSVTLHFIVFHRDLQSHMVPIPWLDDALLYTSIFLHRNQ